MKIRFGFLLLLSGMGLQAASVQFYVSPFGKDTWSGNRPDPAWHHQDGPFLTMDRALAAVRQSREQGAKGDIEVLLREGIYHLDKPLTFLPSDSGTPLGPVRWRAYPEERVEISGGMSIRKWHRIGDNIYQARLADEGYVGPAVKTFFYDGMPQLLARAPNADPAHPWSGGFAYVTAVEGSNEGVWIAYNPFRLSTAGWYAPGARVHLWAGEGDELEILPVTQFDSEQGRILIPAPVHGPVTIGNRFFIEGVPGALDAPGEWFYSPEERTITFIPPDGGSLGRRASIPACTDLIRFEGESEDTGRVSYISLEGFLLSEAERSLVDFSGSTYCGIIRSVLTGCGGEAIRMRNGSHHNRVAGCDIFAVGGDAVRFDAVRDWSYRLTSAMSYNVVTNCHIHHTGMFVETSAAVSLLPAGGGNVSHHNLISRNLIHDIPNAGVMLCGFDNVCEYNNIFYVNQMRSRSGGVVVGSRDRREKGCLIRGNLIHHTGGYRMTEPGLWEYPAGTAGVFLTPGSGNLKITGNGFAYTPEGGVELCTPIDVTIENNAFVAGAKQQILVSSISSGPEERDPGNPDRTTWSATGLRLVRNVFHFDGATAFWLVGSQWRDVLAESDANLVWAGDNPVRIAGGGLDGLEDAFFDWTGFGFDIRSVEADPLVTNPKTGDFRIKPDSIALKLGFEPLQMDEIGLYESPERVSWPPQFGDWRERHITRPPL